MAEHNHDDPGVGDMERGVPGGDDHFWRELCSEMQRAREASPVELADVEKLLAGLEAEDAECAQPAGESRSDVREMEAREEVVGDVPARPRLASSALSRVVRPSFAAAAALLVAPKFLVAAALVTTVAATAGYFLTHTTTSLAFGEAARILVDVHADDFARGAAQGRVAFALAESCNMLRSLDEQPLELQQHAQAVRRELLELLDQTPPFVMRRFDAEIGELAAVVGDRTAEADLRHEALAGLAAQMRYGVAALRAARATLSPALLERNDSWCRGLKQRLK